MKIIAEIETADPLKSDLIVQSIVALVNGLGAFVKIKKPMTTDQDAIDCEWLAEYIGQHIDNPGHIAEEHRAGYLIGLREVLRWLEGIKSGELVRG